MEAMKDAEGEPHKKSKGRGRGRGKGGGRGRRKKAEEALLLEGDHASQAPEQLEDVEPPPSQPRGDELYEEPEMKSKRKADTVAPVKRSKAKAAEVDGVEERKPKAKASSKGKAKHGEKDPESAVSTRKRAAKRGEEGLEPAVSSRKRAAKRGEEGPEPAVSSRKRAAKQGAVEAEAEQAKPSSGPSSKRARGNMEVADPKASKNSKAVGKEQGGEPVRPNDDGSEDSNAPLCPEPVEPRLFSPKCKPPKDKEGSSEYRAKCREEWDLPNFQHVELVIYWTKGHVGIKMKNEPNKGKQALSMHSISMCAARLAQYICSKELPTEVFYVGRNDVSLRHNLNCALSCARI